MHTLLTHLFTLLTLFSLVCCFLTVLAIKWMGDKRIAGFYLGIAAESLWAVYGAETNAYGLSLMAAIFIGMYIRNILHWRKLAS